MTKSSLRTLYRQCAHGILVLLLAALAAQALVETEFQSDWLVLCTADGKLFTVHAWTGSVQSDHVIHTDPLIGSTIMSTVAAATRSTSSKHDDDDDDDDDDTTGETLSTADDHDEDDESLNIILPGLDGRLYWQQDDGSLEALQLEISSLLEQPVKSCHDNHNEKDCGILTATVETSLLALNSHGQVQWYDKHEKRQEFGSGDEENVDDDKPFLLLQRRDYHVKHVWSGTGKQAWNITMGTWQALDFGAPQVDDDDDERTLIQELPGHVHDKRETLVTKENAWNKKHLSLNKPILPAIVFTNHGQTLFAVDLVSMRVLWTMDTPSVVASVFGMQHGQWKPVQVLQEQDLARAKSREHAPQRLLAIDDHSAHERDDEAQQFLAYAMRDWFTASTNSYSAIVGPQRLAAIDPPDRSSSKPKFPRRSAEMNVCMPGDDCRNIPDTKQFLQLPSPSPRVQPEGLYLSWALVGGLLATFVAIAGFAGHFWYLRKKQKWLEDIKTHNEIIMSSVDRQLIPNGDVISKPSHASKEALDQAELPSQEQKDAETAYAAPVTMTAIGGIPLVRYSRYATEFEELEPLGKGGFGTVWRVRNLFDGRHYAMKKVHIHGAVGNPQFHQRLERTLREVKILAALDHPNIVRYYNAWLELEKDVGEETRTEDNTSFDENSLGMTRCYSSSILSDSVSQWPSLRQGADHHFNTRLSSPMRRKFGTPNGTESSLFKGAAWRPKALDDGSDYLIFESESRDMAKESKSDPPQSVDTTVDNDMVDAGILKESLAEAAPLDSPPTENVRHILYIQMQLCTQKTIGDHLSNMPTRKGNSHSGVDIPQALKLFLQIAQAVTYVHAQGLIHRDLKPLNIFVDESGNVQVGDFGLSRESSGEVNKSGSFQRSSSMGDGVDSIDNVDHTAGVGTRAYASPEQMNGRDYGPSTDIYSLGVILFELVYPMHTAMERNICMTRLRNSQFPNDFDKLVGYAFPTISPLLLSMLSERPSKRPSASTIVSHLKLVLSEYTILSLDESLHQGPDMLLLRIETEHSADALTQTIDAIHAAAQALAEPVEVVQYGFRSSGDGDRPAAIIELAIKFKDGDGSVLVSELQKRPSIYSVRQVRPRSESTLSN